jgi:hypothetical protein
MRLVKTARRLESYRRHAARFLEVFPDRPLDAPITDEDVARWKAFAKAKSFKAKVPADPPPSE